MRSLNWETLKAVSFRGYLPDDGQTSLALVERDSHGRWKMTSAFSEDGKESEARFADVAAAKEAADRAMNQWVSRHTSGWKAEPVF